MLPPLTSSTTRQNCSSLPCSEVALGAKVRSAVWTETCPSDRLCARTCHHLRGLAHNDHHLSSPSSSPPHTLPSLRLEETRPRNTINIIRKTRQPKSTQPPQHDMSKDITPRHICPYIQHHCHRAQQSTPKKHTNHTSPSILHEFFHSRDRLHRNRTQMFQQL